VGFVVGAGAEDRVEAGAGMDVGRRAGVTTKVGAGKGVGAGVRAIMDACDGVCSSWGVQIEV
jgi:hypothetical protein